MEDKLTNLLIGLIFVIVLILGGFYVYKIVLDKPRPVVVESNENKVIEPPKSVVAKEESTISSDIKIPLVESEETSQTPIISDNQGKMVYYNNRFYYNQLDKYAKVIYDAVFNKIEHLKQKNYTIKLEYDFSELLKNGDNSKINTCYNDALNALNLDVSNLFYIDFSKMSLSIETTTTILGTKHELKISPRDDKNFLHEGFSSEEEVNEAISRVLSVREQVINRAVSDDYNNLVIIHDWFIEYMQYDSVSINKNSIYGALWERQAVCEGYARAFKYLLDEIGIENVLIIGTATNSSGETEDHMWNYVKYNDQWYAIDCTWDDPVVINGMGTISYAAKHKYFMVGSNKLFESHVERNEISPGGKSFTLPTISKEDY